MENRLDKTEIPRWIQLLGLPLMLLLAWTIGGAISHVLFIFLVAGLIALLLDPTVRALGKVWIPRGFAVALVYLAFALLITLLAAVLITVGVDRGKQVADQVDTYFTKVDGQNQTHADRDIDNFQVWLDQHHLKRVNIRYQAHKFIHNLDVKKVTQRVVSWLEGAAVGTFQFLFSAILIIVVSVYMLLDFGRLARVLDRRYPPPPGSAPLLTRLEHALAGYVKGQVLLSLIIGTSVGVGLWLLGTFGAIPHIDDYALAFGFWVAFTELIPYLGPWLGAAPPLVYALATHPIGAIWVALLFLGIQQIEGHVVVPKVMGSALRLHPLLVIFGLLAGGEIYGLPGLFVALPLLAVTRATWEFFGERVSLQAWTEGGPIDVEVEVEKEVGPPKSPAPPSVAES